jgi:sugar/nucleoside kinase (ribokinase family)
MMLNFNSLYTNCKFNLQFVMNEVSTLWHTPYFISKIGADTEGSFFKKYMEENGVECHFPSPTENMGIPQVLTLITPDGKRTFISFDDVATTFSANDYNFDLLHKTNFLYLNGYSLVSKSTPKSFVKAGVALRHRGGHVTFNIGDIGYYTTQKNDVDAILNTCDSIICNAEEARILYGEKDTPENLAKKND